ncbi:hypothetical protein [Streptomyces sp. NBC_00198]|uniref:hypothetical protein n=1 Tax=Streptomyces sp. NBC_00198 TaxID=2975677 RepID=UPI00224DBC3D|nr:hypothetical protein [Streptomyces sp. NBC_00198]MCX5285939.1 hypothetical protein [Streptomyces sp. NBC_00198]MCX5286248.1 hypothetical protein [Streptomyces sp. NBC_00198]
MGRLERFLAKTNPHVSVPSTKAMEKAAKQKQKEAKARKERSAAHKRSVSGRRNEGRWPW